MPLIYRFLVCCFCITGVDDVDSHNEFNEKSKDKSQ